MPTIVFINNVFNLGYGENVNMYTVHMCGGDSQIDIE